MLNSVLVEVFVVLRLAEEYYGMGRNFRVYQAKMGAEVEVTLVCVGQSVALDELSPYTLRGELANFEGKLVVFVKEIVK